MAKRKYDPSLVRLSLLMMLFTVCFVVAVVLANRAGKREAALPRPNPAPASQR